MNDLTKKTESDLLKDLAGKREALRNFRHSIAGSKLKNVRHGRGLRKDIAQILTTLTARRKDVW